MIKINFSHSFQMFVMMLSPYRLYQFSSVTYV